MFRILKSEYPHFKFGVNSESTFQTVEEEQEEDDGEIGVVSRAFAHVDMIITSWRDGEDPQIVLLIEHRTPGTLRRWDWVNNTHNLLLMQKKLSDRFGNVSMTVATTQPVSTTLRL